MTIIIKKHLGTRDKQFSVITSKVIQIDLCHTLTDLSRFNKPKCLNIK